MHPRHAIQRTPVWHVKALEILFLCFFIQVSPSDCNVTAFYAGPKILSMSKFLSATVYNALEDRRCIQVHRH
jgi:hypothetical protein